MSHMDPEARELIKKLEKDLADLQESNEAFHIAIVAIYSILKIFAPRLDDRIQDLLDELRDLLFSLVKGIEE